MSQVIEKKENVELNVANLFDGMLLGINSPECTTHLAPKKEVTQ